MKTSAPAQTSYMFKIDRTDIPPNKFWKEPWSAMTHFAGFLAAIVGLIVLLVQSPSAWPKIACFAAYGLSLVMLFFSSAAYHFFDLGERGNFALRRLDHAAIFVLIAGTYLPAIVHMLDGGWRLGMLIAICTIGLMGVVFKLTVFHAPRWIDVILYLAMGWAVVVPGARMFENMSSASLTWILLGGILYTIGAVVYALKKPDPWPGRFGFHEVWHVFVLAAGSAHYLFVYSLLEAPYPAF